MEYKFKINEFEGPFDLLLHLIKESKMDIMNIEIVKLTNQYLDYINSMEQMKLTVASEYLTLASELIYLKSKTLLPKRDDEEDDEQFEEAKTDLVNRLLEYKKYKEVTETLKLLEEKRSYLYTKDVSDLTDYKSDSINLEGNVSIDDLVDAFKKYLKRMEYKKPLSTKVTVREISVKERKKSIRNLLNKKKKVEFFELFDEVTKDYIVATFLSILEMAKEKELIINQENNFDKIYCEAI